MRAPLELARPLITQRHGLIQPRELEGHGTEEVELEISFEHLQAQWRIEQVGAFGANVRRQVSESQSGHTGGQRDPTRVPHGGEVILIDGDAQSRAIRRSAPDFRRLGEDAEAQRGNEKASHGLVFILPR